MLVICSSEARLFSSAHLVKIMGILPGHLSVNLGFCVAQERCIFTVVVAVAVALLLLWLIKPAFSKKRRLPPAIPGLPVVGNMMQLRERKPFRTFTAWAEKYGPIFCIRLGAQKLVVINSAEIAKEAMIDKYSSISSRKMTTAFHILTRQKTLVVTSDYGDEHRLLKKLVVSHLLGAVPQKQNRTLRERVSYKMLDGIYAALSEYPGSVGLLNIREHISRALYPFALYQVIGRDPEFTFVEEMDRNVCRCESFNILITAPMKTFLRVDWRNLFPAFKWVPNKTVELEVSKVEFERTAVIRAFIREQRKLLAHGKKPNCFLDTLLMQAKDLTSKQLEMSTWEPIIETADTTLVTIEWIMYELAKRPDMQERIYKEITEVAGDGIIKEDDLPRLPLLTASVIETLRKHPAVPLILPRFVDEDVQLGGYDVPRGWEVLINIYGINYDKMNWPNPDSWDPDRVLGDKNLDLGYKDHRALPFGTGKRMCPGVVQAMYVIPANIAYFVQHFKWTLPPEDSSIHTDDTMYFTTHRQHPLEVIVTPRVAKRLNA